MDALDFIDGYEEHLGPETYGQWRVAFCGLGWRVDYAPLRGAPKPDLDLHNQIGSDAAAFIADETHDLHTHAEAGYSFVSYRFAGCSVVFIRYGDELLRDAALSTKH